MKGKCGVTIIALAITIVVLAILITTTFINIDMIFPAGRKAKIAEEFNLIEEKVKEYYLTYGNYPVINNITYTKAEVVALNTTGKATLLSEEITKNGDGHGVFFLVDLSKLRINTLILGNGNTQDDIYIASAVSGTLYYPKGISLNDKTVFSTATFRDGINID